VLAIAMTIAARTTDAAEPRVPRVALQAAADRQLPAAVLDAIGTNPAFPVSIRLSLNPGDAASVRGAEAVLRESESRHLKLWLATPMPASAQDVDAWRAALRQWLAAHKQSLAILELRLPAQPGDAAAFAIRAAATDLRVASAGSGYLVSGQASHCPVERVRHRVEAGGEGHGEHEHVRVAAVETPAERLRHQADVRRGHAALVDRLGVVEPHAEIAAAAQHAVTAERARVEHELVIRGESLDEPRR